LTDRFVRQSVRRAVVDVLPADVRGLLAQLLETVARETGIPGARRPEEVCLPAGPVPDDRFEWGGERIEGFLAWTPETERFIL
jgi:hypothetical protein